MDAFWEEVLMPWDFAAGIVIVSEAGGLVTGPNSEELALRPGPVRGANSPALLEELQTVINTGLPKKMRRIRAHARILLEASPRESRSN